MAVSVYSLKIREENRKLKEISEHFREINAIYRNRLFGLFYGKCPSMERKDLINIEKFTLNSVCQRISKIYSMLIAKNCTVSVKLLMQQEDTGRLYVTTYTRSENACKHDDESPSKFEVNTGQNTAFDDALRRNTTGDITHFFSGDLRKHKHYRNQRPNWSKYYQSAIVVPIRCLGVEENPDPDDIGFLCVDTNSRHRLNNTHHVVMLSGLADQIYNFMSLMRGKYNVPGAE